jgi:hypothetical protein
MYLHTGNNRIVFHGELIGIFNYSLHDNPKKDQGALPLVNRGETKLTKMKKYKSIIITDRETYPSPISPLTLAGRNFKGNFFSD